MNVRVLDNEVLLEGVETLAAGDPDLGSVVHCFGPPPLWGRKPGFATLVRIVLEQQVSLASARSVFGRLRDTLGGVTPSAVTEIGEEGLRQLGFTRQKAAYCCHIAENILSGVLDLRSLGKMGDDGARETLLRLRGVGPWTAEIYLLMALRRPDVWPDGDIALMESARLVKCLRSRPAVDRLRHMATGWRPWRSVAARILWHNYLSIKVPKKG